MPRLSCHISRYKAQTNGSEVLFNATSRFTFNGQEKDDEVYGEGNSLSFKYRIEDSRLGRFFSVDPLAWKYPYNSVYAFAENDVISNIELEGQEKGGVPSQEKGDGTKTTAVDNTSVVGIAEEKNKVAPIPLNNGTITDYKPNFVELARQNVLDPKPEDSFVITTLKRIGLVIYQDLNEKVIYTCQVLKIPPRDLEGHGKNPKEIQDAGINTIQSVAASSRVINLAGKTLDISKNYSQYVGMLRKSGGSNFPERLVNDNLWNREVFISRIIPTMAVEANLIVSYVTKSVTYYQNNYVIKR